MGKTYRRIGDILLEMGAIDDLQLRAGLSHAQQWGMKTGRALVERHFCSEQDLLRALSIQSGLSLIDLDHQALDVGLVASLPLKTATAHRVVPLRLEGKRQEILVVAASGPAGLTTLDAVRAVSRKSKVMAFLAADDAVERAINFLYHGKPREVLPSATVPIYEVNIESETTFELESEAATGEPEKAVILFGWDSARERALAAMLQMAQLPAQALSPDNLETCDQDDVVIAPTLSLQAVVPAGQRFSHGKLVVCGVRNDGDIGDARALGARIYLRPPFSAEQLGRAVRRCRAS